MGTLQSYVNRCYSPNFDDMIRGLKINEYWFGIYHDYPLLVANNTPVKAMYLAVEKENYDDNRGLINGELNRASKIKIVDNMNLKDFGVSAVIVVTENDDSYFVSTLSEDEISNEVIRISKDDIDSLGTLQVSIYENYGDFAFKELETIPRGFYKWY